MDNQYSFWQTGQIVTQAQIESLSNNNIYTMFTELVAKAAPCILGLDGTPSIAAGLISMPSGAFAFTPAAINGFTTIIMSMAAAQEVAYSGDGVIVAEYNISPNTAGAYTYTVTATYSFITGSPSSIQCPVIYITNDAISAYGNNYINSAASNSDVTDAILTPENAVSNVALTPANLPTIFNILPSDYNREFQITSSPYSVVPSNNFTFLLNTQLATPATYNVDFVTNTFLKGFSCCIYDDVSYPVTINLINSSGTETISGEQQGGYYKIVSDGGDLFVVYKQAFGNYNPVVTKNQLPIAATIAFDSQAVNNDSTNPVPTADKIGSSLITMSGNIIGLPANKSFQLVYTANGYIPPITGPQASNQSIFTASITQTGATFVGATVQGALSNTSLIASTDNSGATGNLVATMILTTGVSGSNISIILGLTGNGSGTASIATNSSLQITEVLTD